MAFCESFIEDEFFLIFMNCDVVVRNSLIVSGVHRHN